MPWQNPQGLHSKQYTCGHCNSLVASSTGYTSTNVGGRVVYLCPHCDRPTYFDGAVALPGVPFGAAVAHRATLKASAQPQAGTVDPRPVRRGGGFADHAGGHFATTMSKPRCAATFRRCAMTAR